MTRFIIDLGFGSSKRLIRFYQIVDPALEACEPKLISGEGLSLAEAFWTVNSTASPLIGITLA